MPSMGCCSVARLQMKVGHMDGMHCIIDSTSILVKIKSVSLYNCRTLYNKQPDAQQSQPIPTIVNHFLQLDNLQE